MQRRPEGGAGLPDEQETLQELVRRRKRELGSRGKELTNTDIWRRGGQSHWSRQAVNNIVNGHVQIGDRIAERLALALEVPVNQILEAAGQRRRIPFEPPERANRLTNAQRKIVIAVIDGFLGAYDEEAFVHVTARTQSRQRKRLQSVKSVDIPKPNLQLPGAARRRPPNVDSEQPPDGPNSAE